MSTVIGSGTEGSLAQSRPPGITRCCARLNKDDDDDDDDEEEERDEDKEEEEEDQQGQDDGDVGDDDGEDVDDQRSEDLFPSPERLTALSLRLSECFPFWHRSSSLRPGTPP